MENDSVKLKNSPKFLWLKLGIAFAIIDLFLFIPAYSNIDSWSLPPGQVSDVILFLNFPALILSREVTPAKYYPPSSFSNDDLIDVTPVKSPKYFLGPYVDFVFASIIYSVIGAIVGLVIQKLKTRKVIQ